MLRIERAIGNDATLKAWYQAKCQNLGYPQKVGHSWQSGSNQVLTLLKDQRDVEVHERPVPLRTYVDVHTK